MPDVYTIFMSIEYPYIHNIFCPTEVICSELGNKHVV